MSLYYHPEGVFVQPDWLDVVAMGWSDTEPLDGCLRVSRVYWRRPRDPVSVEWQRRKSGMYECISHPISESSDMCWPIEGYSMEDASLVHADRPYGYDACEWPWQGEVLGSMTGLQEWSRNGYWRALYDLYAECHRWADEMFPLPVDIPKPRWSE